MMRQFLDRSNLATSLDRKEFDAAFPAGTNRADYLLFDGKVICELKEFHTIDVEKQVQKLSKKGPLPTKVFNQYFCNSVINAIGKANSQIADTRQALNCTDAAGLIVLENCVPAKMSGLTLFSAANQVMETMPHLDCALILDLVNYFEGPEGDKLRFSQLLCNRHERSARLAELVPLIMRDFSDQTSIPVKEGYLLESAEQVWQGDSDGVFHKYKASLRFR
jgi:hypothetical protein